MKEDFEAKNKQLLEEMPKFYSSRIDYFKPSFESLVRAQVRCCPLSTSCPFGGHPPCRASGVLQGGGFLLEPGTFSSCVLGNARPSSAQTSLIPAI